MIRLIPVSIADESRLKEYVLSYEANGAVLEGNTAMIPHMPFDVWFETLGNSNVERTHMILEDDVMVGSLDFRLNSAKHTRMTLGDIGYSVHPDHRGKGYASKALGLAITIYPLNEIIITCYESNLASVKVIERNGGILRNTFLFDKVISNRYIIYKSHSPLNDLDIFKTFQYY